MIYKNLEDQKVIQEVIETQFPTASRLFSDARRAADTIMQQFTSTARRNEAHTLQDLNTFAIELKRYHRDIQTIYSKVDELLDNPKTKMSVNVRMKGTKLQNVLDGYKTQIAAALAQLPG